MINVLLMLLYSIGSNALAFDDSLHLVFISHLRSKSSGLIKYLYNIKDAKHMGGRLIVNRGTGEKYKILDYHI